MPYIKVLDESLRNKIAAGEVVERPASVVKELIENSIDAGGESIEVEVFLGGKKLIRVTDDGCGMDREDALLSIQRHATSKISSLDDLFDLRTMGFRGEALSSIAAVSKFTLTTAPRGQAIGVSIEAEGGEIKHVKDAPSRGTSIAVRDIFFNTPARKKFMKRESTELLHIVEAVTAISLSHPAIRFVLKADGHETLNLPKASGLRERLIQIYGHEFVEALSEAKKEDGGVSLHIFVSKPGNSRGTRAHQLFFVNGRPVREPSLSHAIYGSFEGTIPKDNHPLFFVFINMPPRHVDFNVHPAKREVRFEDKETLYGFLKKTVMETIRPSNFPAPDECASPASAVAFSPSGGSEFGWAGISETLSLDYRAELPFIYLGETFIAFTKDGGLTLIDHHAAHERVLYEKFLKGLDLKKSTRLLFPKQVKLSRREYMAVMEQIDMLKDFGMEAEDFGEDTLIVRSLPEALMDADIRGILTEIAGGILDGIKPGKGLKEAVAARIACHSSVRGSKVLSREGLQRLIDDLDGTEDPGRCPHGRPTRIHYTLDDLRRHFKRK